MERSRLMTPSACGRLLLCATAVALASCEEAPDRFLKAHHGPRDGVVALETEKFVVVFESLPLPTAYRSGSRYDWDLQVSITVHADGSASVS
jgi:hypothetical protein